METQKRFIRYFLVKKTPMNYIDINAATKNIISKLKQTIDNIEIDSYIQEKDKTTIINIETERQINIGTLTTYIIKPYIDNTNIKSSIKQNKNITTIKLTNSLNESKIYKAINSLKEITNKTIQLI